MAKAGLIHSFYTLHKKHADDCQNQEGFFSMQEFSEEMINILLSHKDNAAYPYREMALTLRLTQAFCLSPSPTLSLTKLVKEYKYEDSNDTISLLKRGELERFKDSLKTFADYNKQTHFFHWIERCVSPSDRILGHPYGTNDLNLFHQKFESSKREAASMYSDFTRNENNPTVKSLMEIARIISGDTAAFMRTNPSWIELLLFHCLFVDAASPGFSRLFLLIKEKFHLDVLDFALLEMMITNNVHAAIQKLSEIFPLAFTAHLAEILVISRKLPIEPQRKFEDLNYAEHYYFLLVKDILTDESIEFRVICDLILENLGSHPHYKELVRKALVHRQPTSDPTCITNYLIEKELNEEISFFTEFHVKYCLSNNLFAQALEWSAFSEESALKKTVEAAILNEAVTLSEGEVQQLIQQIPYNLTADSTTLIFLKKFVEYSEHINSQNYVKGADLLIEFLVKRASPIEFLNRIILLARDLFTSNVRFTRAEVLCIMQECERVLNKARGTSLSTQEIREISYNLNLIALHRLS